MTAPAKHDSEPVDSRGHRGRLRKARAQVGPKLGHVVRLISCHHVVEKCRPLLNNRAGGHPRIIGHRSRCAQLLRGWSRMSSGGIRRAQRHRSCGTSRAPSGPTEASRTRQPGRASTNDIRSSVGPGLHAGECQNDRMDRAHEPQLTAPSRSGARNPRTEKHQSPAAAFPRTETPPGRQRALGAEVTQPSSKPRAGCCRNTLLQRPSTPRRSPRPL